MKYDLNALRDLEKQVIECVDIAIEAGLDSSEGLNAFKLGMEKFNASADLKSRLIYEPLADDPATRDYVTRLDDQLFGLSERIDILRAYIELTIDGQDMETDTLELSLHRLRRRLLVMFRREAALGPVFEAWCKRHDRVLPDIADPMTSGVTVFH